MPARNRTGLVCLLLAIALLVGVVAGVGVFMRGDADKASTTSVRGEHYEYVTSGVYAFNSQRVVAEGVGWDVVTLFLVVPALLVALPFVARNSLWGRLFALGVLGYLLYQYLEYSVTWAFGPLFLPFVAIYALSAVGIGWLVSTIDIAGLPSRFAETFPRRGMAALCWAMAALLVVMWVARIAAALRGQAAGSLSGETTMTVQALDLGLVVPLCVWTGVAIWRRSPVGYLLACAFAVMAAGMATAIGSMLVSAAIVEGAVEIVPLAIFGGAALWAGSLALRMYRSGGRGELSRRSAASVAPTTGLPSE